MMDCKRALEANDGDIEKAIAWLREKGVARAAGKAGRDAREGVVSSYIHTGGRVGVLVEVNSRDRLRRSQRRLPEARPRRRDADRRPGAALHHDRIDPGRRRSRPSAPSCSPTRTTLKKPENIRGQIVDGQLKKWYQQVVLYEQPFRDTDQTVGQLITDAIARIGENIRVRRFTRYALGEEL